MIAHARSCLRSGADTWTNQRVDGISLWYGVTTAYASRCTVKRSIPVAELFVRPERTMTPSTGLSSPCRNPIAGIGAEAKSNNDPRAQTAGPGNGAGTSPHELAVRTQSTAGYLPASQLSVWSAAVARGSAGKAHRQRPAGTRRGRFRSYVGSPPGLPQADDEHVHQAGGHGHGLRKG